MNLKTIVNNLVALSLLGGCATANLSPGERLTELTVNDSSTGETKTYKTTDQSDQLLRTVMGIEAGTITVFEGYNGNMHVSGRLPNQLSHLSEFDEVYRRADTNGDGIVDTPEAEALYQKALER